LFILHSYFKLKRFASTGPEQGFPCVHREKPVYSSWDPCNENRFFPFGKNTQGIPCFHRDGFAVHVFCSLTFKASLILENEHVFFIFSGLSDSRIHGCICIESFIDFSQILVT
jgi:hypothetical protein